MRPLTISADPTTAALRAALVERFGLTDAADTPDIAVVTEPPETPAAHVILAGPVSDEVDTWDKALPAQTVAGALWLVPDQPDPQSAAIAWLLLRLQSPATPLSDLTDGNERALRWSVVAAVTVDRATPQAPEVDPAEVKDWVDAQPAVQELGAAVDRLGGDSADAVLASVQRFHAALAGIDGDPAGGDFEAAVAEHLRQVQRSGFGRWRGAKARAASAAALQEAGRQVAGRQVTRLLQARQAELAAQAAQEVADQHRAGFREQVRQALDGLQLPVSPDFGKVPRSWAASAPEPRRYVFVADDEAEDLSDLPATVRGCEQVPTGTAVCALVQSGFSLAALR